MPGTPMGLRGASQGLRNAGGLMTPVNNPGPRTPAGLAPATPAGLGFQGGNATPGLFNANPRTPAGLGGVPAAGTPAGPGGQQAQANITDLMSLRLRHTPRKMKGTGEMLPPPTKESTVPDNWKNVPLAGCGQKKQKKKVEESGGVPDFRAWKKQKRRRPRDVTNLPAAEEERAAAEAMPEMQAPKVKETDDGFVQDMEQRSKLETMTPHMPGEVTPGQPPAPGEMTPAMPPGPGEDTPAMPPGGDMTPFMPEQPPAGDGTPAMPPPTHGDVTPGMQPAPGENTPAMPGDMTANSFAGDMTPGMGEMTPRPGDMTPAMGDMTPAMPPPTAPAGDETPFEVPYTPADLDEVARSKGEATPVPQSGEQTPPLVPSSGQVPTMPRDMQASAAKAPMDKVTLQKEELETPREVMPGMETPMEMPGETPMKPGMETPMLNPPGASGEETPSALAGAPEAVPGTMTPLPAAQKAQANPLDDFFNERPAVTEAAAREGVKSREETA